MGHVGHHASLSEYEENLLNAGIVPVILEGVFACSLVHGEEIILSGVVLGHIFRTGVGISHSVTRIEGVVAVHVKGHHIVIEEALLTVGTALPPSEGITHGTAAEVVVLGAVPDPVL